MTETVARRTVDTASRRRRDRYLVPRRTRTTTLRPLNASGLSRSVRDPSAWTRFVAIVFSLQYEPWQKMLMCSKYVAGP